MVVIWLATRKRLNLAFYIRPVGSVAWASSITELNTIEIFPELFINLAIMAPGDKETFPAGRLLEYSIAETDADGNDDHASFAEIVIADGLSYPGFTLPTFYLQGKDQKLSAFYGSCRKPHDTKGGGRDAMAFGDDFIYNNPKVIGVRPAILCLGGDQIYADDVHSAVFDEIARIAKALEGSKAEVLPGASIPNPGHRQDFMLKQAKFTSDAADNHLITFAEYVAMYGLVWNRANWLSGPLDPAVQGFANSLPRVRRLLANTPTYMIYDDHDVTDDWNLCVSWSKQVNAFLVGRRIVTNALFAYWLFQGWGNDPDRYKKYLPAIVDMAANRLTKPETVDSFFWALQGQEFYTPTYPFVYFLDTRTERGHRDGITAVDDGAPAYLKKVTSWATTVTRIKALQAKQSSDQPLVLVAPAPVFGFETIDALQQTASAVLGPYTYDLEGWSANLKHLLLFLGLCTDQDVVLLSGDVHYGYTSTVKFSNFDDDFARAVARQFPMLTFPKKGDGANPTYQFLYASKYIQLTSSALMNYASSVLQQASKSGGEYSWFVNNKGEVNQGTYKNGELKIVLKPRTHQDPDPAPEVVKLEVYKPGCALFQKYNDAYNSPYVADHNLGYVLINKKKVEHSFLVGSGPTSRRTWDFANSIYWEGK